MSTTNSTSPAVNADKKPLSTAHQTTLLVLIFFDIFFLLFAFISFCLNCVDAAGKTRKYDVLSLKSYKPIGALIIALLYSIIGIVRLIFSWKQYQGSGQYYYLLAILTAILTVLSVLTVIFGIAVFGVLALIFNLAYFVLITMMYNNVY